MNMSYPNLESSATFEDSAKTIDRSYVFATNFCAARCSTSVTIKDNLFSFLCDIAIPLLPELQSCPSFACAADAVYHFKTRHSVLHGMLDQKKKRIIASLDAILYGSCYTQIIREVYGIGRSTLYRGIKEVNEYIESGENTSRADFSRCRKPGGGRKPINEKFPGIDDAVLRAVNIETSGDPESPLLYTSKSLYNIRNEVYRVFGELISTASVRKILNAHEYSLQSMVKKIAGFDSPYREAQFLEIEAILQICKDLGIPGISVDAKNKINIGKFARNGREWHKKDCPAEGFDHDYPSWGIGKVTPYSIFDFNANEGLVCVGLYHDTAEFSVNSIAYWYEIMGSVRYPNANTILITCDCGGSNGYKLKLWKVMLQKFADEYGLRIIVVHYPPGSSKYNKVEHGMHGYISMNWRGVQLDSKEKVVQYIRHTKTKAGLHIEAVVDERIYQKGIKVTREEMESLNLTSFSVLPQFNYVITPRSTHQNS
jgi:hypothetical protein